MARQSSPHDLASAWTRNTWSAWQMALGAWEVMFRRSMMMSRGAMSASEAVAMVMEKQTAFAAAAEKAGVAVARGADPARATAAALRPVGRRVRANVRRLRR